jgi:hypothetical protein
MKVAILAAVTLMVVTLIFFEVDLDLEFSLPQEIDVLDPEQETRFGACVTEKDQEIHAMTFRDIDNPDVQREILTTQKQLAISDCRQSLPEIRVTVSEPLRFNIIDLRFRY